MAFTATVGAVVDLPTKVAAKIILDKLDISLSEAVRLYLAAIVKHGRIPFKYSNENRCGVKVEAKPL